MKLNLVRVTIGGDQVFHFLCKVKWLVDSGFLFSFKDWEQARNLKGFNYTGVKFRLKPVVLRLLRNTSATFQVDSRLVVFHGKTGSVQNLTLNFLFKVSEHEGIMRR